MDAEINIYLEDMMSCQWNLSREYFLDIPNEYTMKRLRAKIYSDKHKIAKRIDGLKKGILI